MLDLAIKRIDLHDHADGKVFDFGGLLAIGGTNQRGALDLALLRIFGSLAEFLARFEAFGFGVALEKPTGEVLFPGRFSRSSAHRSAARGGEAMVSFCSEITRLFFSV